MNNRNITSCNINIINAIVSSNLDIASHNNKSGKKLGAHMSEAIVQDIIVRNLYRCLPTDCLGDIISENKGVGVKNFIPDIIIRKPENRIWGIFELKTLLSEDKLAGRDVKKDLKKLCQYNSVHKDALCCFILAIERTRILSVRSNTLLPLAIVPSAFISDRDRPIEIGNNFYAIPWMSSETDLDVALYLWRVCHKDNVKNKVSGEYKFNISF